MKTILHISKYYFPDLGGIETVAMYLAEGMKDYQNVVICFSTDRQYHEDVIHGTKVYRVPVELSLLSQDIAFTYPKVLKRVLKEYQPEFVHVHCPNPFVYPLVLKEVKKPAKVVVHWHSDILSKGIAYNLIRPLETQLLKKAAVVVSTSPNYITLSTPLTRFKEKVQIVPNGIIRSNFDKRPGDDKRIQEIRNTYKDKFLILTVGRHVPYKGLDMLIKAEQYINGDVQILIGGKGPETNALKRLANNNPRITFLERLSDNSLRCFCHAADIVAFPSITKAEAFGISLAEAMYCRCAPVTFSIPGSGVNWLSLKGDTGEEVPLYNIYAFAEAIDKIVSDPELMERYSTASHLRIEENFTQEKAIEAMTAVYKSLEE